MYDSIWKYVYYVIIEIMPPERIYICLKGLPPLTQDNQQIVEVLHPQLVHEGGEILIEDGKIHEEIHDAGGEEKEVIHHLVKDDGFQEEKLLDPTLLDDEGEEEEVVHLSIFSLQVEEITGTSLFSNDMCLGIFG